MSRESTLRRRSKGKPTFNFDPRYRSQDFTVMIWDDDRRGFGDLDPKAWFESLPLQYHGTQWLEW
jgi:hypothetical protein